MNPAGPHTSASIKNESTATDSFLIEAPMPAWFARLDVARVPFPELRRLGCRFLSDLRHVPASALPSRAVSSVRRFIAELRKQEERRRAHPSWKSEIRRDESKPQTRTTSPRRQRPKPDDFTRQPYKGQRIRKGPLTDRSKGGHWTDIQTDYLCMRWADGLACKSIGIEMGTTKNSVLARLYRLGLLANGMPLVDRRDEPAPPLPPTRKIARSAPRIERAPAPLPEPVREEGIWTQELKDKLSALWAEGETCVDIAKALGIDPPDVFAKLSELGRFSTVAPSKADPSPEGPGWQPSEIAALRRWKAAGKKPIDMARKLGRTKNSVIGKLHRLGLLEPRAPRR